jgi:hypothetical protein
MEDYRDFKRLRLGWILAAIFITGYLVTFSQTKAEVYNYIKSCNLEHPEIVFKQVLLETGHLKSNIFRYNNNCFGMKLAKKRHTLATGEGRGHAIYSSWQMSIVDYQIWQRLYYKGGDYYQFLTRMGYATSPTYINKLKGIKV